MFYSGKFAHAVNYSNYAGKQYDLITDVEENLQGKTVFDVYEWGKDTLSLGGMELQPYQIVDNFRYFNRVKIDIPAFSYTVPLDSILPIEVTIRNTTNKPIDFSAFKDQMSIQYCLFWYGKDQFCEKAISDFPIEQLKPLETRKMQLNIRTPKDTGTHWRFRFAINYNGIMGRNSDFTKLKIEE